MEKGRIIQEGTHGELMEAGGAYAELFALQARYYQEKNRGKGFGTEDCRQENHRGENREEEQYA